MEEIVPFPVWIIPFPVLKMNFELLGSIEKSVSLSVIFEIVKLASQLKIK